MNLKEITEKFDAYIVTQRENLKFLTTEDLPFDVEIINSISPETAEFYKKEIAELNFKVFGPMGLGSKAWVDAHFGCIAGATVGLKEKETGKVISMARFVGHIDPKKFELWTLMVHPDYQGRGIGKATLALACWLNRNREVISLIEQIENPVNMLYLKLRTDENPLILNAIGFYHSQMPNSLNIEVKIPKDPFKQIFSKRKPKEPKGNFIFIDDVDDFSEVNNRLILLSASAKNINKLGECVARGKKFEIIYWYDSAKANEKFDMKEPLLVIKAI